MYAVTFHARPRFSKDLDVWVEPGKENAARVLGALGQFGAPLDGVGPQDFSNPAMVFQIGVEPNRIDILMGIEGAAFSDAWKRRAESTYGEISIT